MITGFPSFTDPQVTYGITCYEGTWYFGELTANNMDRKHHMNKPYGNFSHTNEEDQLAILTHARRIADRLVVVTSENSLPSNEHLDLKVVDQRRAYKNKRRKFVRYIWVYQ